MIRRWISIPSLVVGVATATIAAAVEPTPTACERPWTRAALARGPIAIANGVLLPFRALAGGLTGGLVAGLLSPIALSAGALEGAAWMVAGVVDTSTAGALAVSPDGITRIQLDPIQIVPEGHRSYDEYDDDPCGSDAPTRSSESGERAISATE